MSEYPNHQIVRFLPVHKGSKPDLVLELVFDSADEVTTDELRNLGLEGMAGQYYWREERSQYNWGATGPDISTLVIEFGIGLAAGRTDKIIERMATKWRNRHRPAEYHAVADNADQAWFIFARVLKAAFGEDSRPKVIKLVHDNWQITAQGEKAQYDGYVSESGRVTYIERVDVVKQ